jgi:hypothetical protein
LAVGTALKLVTAIQKKNVADIFLQQALLQRILAFPVLIPPNHTGSVSRILLQMSDRKIYPAKETM